MGDEERGARIKARREELHLTQPAVVDLIEEAALALPETHPTHPKTAMKGPVTLRGYQAWERGGGIVWERAKLLAQVLQMDVAVMMNGEPEPERTPDMFPARPVKLEGMQGAMLEAVVQQMQMTVTVLKQLRLELGEQMAQQTDVLHAIKRLLQREGDAATSLERATARADDAARRFESLSEEAEQAIRTQPTPGAVPPRPPAAPKGTARRRTPKAAAPESP